MDKPYFQQKYFEIMNEKRDRNPKTIDNNFRDRE